MIDFFELFGGKISSKKKKKRVKNTFGSRRRNKARLQALAPTMVRSKVAKAAVNAVAKGARTGTGTGTSGFMQWVHSEHGPKTTHFWGPVANWGFVLAVRRYTQEREREEREREERKKQVKTC